MPSEFLESFLPKENWHWGFEANGAVVCKSGAEPQRAMSGSLELRETGCFKSSSLCFTAPAGITAVSLRHRLFAFCCGSQRAIFYLCFLVFALISRRWGEMVEAEGLILL